MSRNTFSVHWRDNWSKTCRFVYLHKHDADLPVVPTLLLFIRCTTMDAALIDVIRLTPRAHQPAWFEQGWPNLAEPSILMRPEVVDLPVRGKRGNHNCSLCARCACKLPTNGQHYHKSHTNFSTRGNDIHQYRFDTYDWGIVVNRNEHIIRNRCD